METRRERNVVSTGGLVKAQERIQQRGLPCPIRPQQPDGPPAERGLQLLQDGAVAEPYFEGIEFDNRGVH